MKFRIKRGTISGFKDANLWNDLPFDAWHFIYRSKERALYLFYRFFVVHSIVEQ